MTLALLFDLDGTLLHTDPLHAAVFADLFAERGREIDGDFYLRHIHGRQNVDIFTEFFPGEDPHEMSDAKEATFRARLGSSVAPTAGLVALLDHARGNGWPIALVTNAPRVNAEAMLNAIGLRARFDTLIIGDECSHGKPHPEPYLAAMRALQVAPARCVAFEDSPSGIAAAAAAGALTIGIRSSLPDDALRAAGATRTFADFADPGLADLLAQHNTPQGAFTA